MRAAAEPAKPGPSWAERFASRWTVLRNFLLNAVGVAVFVGAAWLLWGAVTKPTIAIAPISVPEELEKKGYTSELTAQKVRAAVDKLIREAKSAKSGAEVAGRSEIPDIVVPRTGLSVETIAAQIRKILGRSNRWQVSGGIAARGDLYEMNLKIANDTETVPSGGPIVGKDIESLIEKSAQDILGAADPYLLASFYSEGTNIKESLHIGRIIIELYPKSEAAFWAHNMIGVLYRRKLHELDAASTEFREAMKFQPADALMHGTVAVLSRSLFGATLDKNFAGVHINLGNVLSDQGKSDAAIAEYKKAIELDPKNAGPHINLGAALHNQGKRDEAIAEFRKAIELDPNDAYPHNNLGLALQDQGKHDEAIAEYRKAVELSPDNAVFRSNLERAQREQQEAQAPREASKPPAPTAKKK